MTEQQRGRAVWCRPGELIPEYELEKLGASNQADRELLEEDGVVVNGDVSTMPNVILPPRSNLVRVLERPRPGARQPPIRRLLEPLKFLLEARKLSDADIPFAAPGYRRGAIVVVLGTLARIRGQA